jgi:hypothetical protein
MSGRPKVKRFEYDSNGKYIKEYDCENDVRKSHYPNDIGKRPLFTNKQLIHNYHILPNGNFVTKERIGRKGIIEIQKRLNNDFIKIKNNDKNINVYNLDNKIIATFANIQIASKLSNIPIGTIHHQLNTKVNKFTERGILFKYE